MRFHHGHTATCMQIISGEALKLPTGWLILPRYQPPGLNQNWPGKTASSLAHVPPGSFRRAASASSVVVSCAR